MKLFLLISTLLISWVSPGMAAMYRCHDQSGATVLTDNPTQLHNCSQLEGSATSVPSNSKVILQGHAHNESASTPHPTSAEKNPDTSILGNSQHAPQQEQDLSIPLKKIGGSFVVQVNLNEERTAQLIVDTGASMTVLSTAIAIDLGILGTTDNELLTINTAGGSVQVNMNFLASLQVGTAEANHVAVAIHDLPDVPEQIEGLLGMSFLKHFLVTLDAAHARLILRPKQSS